VTTISASKAIAHSRDGLRPVNLRTDLAPLADLIEVVFANRMDSSGRAIISEMRTLSRVGAGLGLLARFNGASLGLSLGYVWIGDGKLVGNVSIARADWPHEMGSAYTIYNVGVHPDYQRRGFASEMMQASMDLIRQRGGHYALLQVETDNEGARQLYSRLGFVTERCWATWRRQASTVVPHRLSDLPVHITRRKHQDRIAEYKLARRLRPSARGGLGWLRPLYPGLFHPSWRKRLSKWFQLQHREYLVIRSPDKARVLASLWIESPLMIGSTQLTLVVEPEYQGLYDDALINTAVQRFGHARLVIEHPSDETDVSHVLKRYGFKVRREVHHMRWDAR